MFTCGSWSTREPRPYDPPPEDLGNPPGPGQETMMAGLTEVKVDTHNPDRGHALTIDHG